MIKTRQDLTETAEVMAAAVALKSMLRFVILYHRFVILYHRFVILFTLTQFHGRIFSFFVALGSFLGFLVSSGVSLLIKPHTSYLEVD